MTTGGAKTLDDTQMGVVTGCTRRSGPRSSDFAPVSVKTRTHAGDVRKMIRTRRRSVGIAHRFIEARSESAGGPGEGLSTLARF
jgi:hypothetical protein